MANPIWSPGCKNLKGFLLALAVFVTAQGCSNSQPQSSVSAVLPIINSFSASSAMVPAGGTTTLTLKASNANGETTASTMVNTIAPDMQLVYTDPPAGGKIRLVKDAERS